MRPVTQAADTPYMRACNGRLTGVLRWPDLDALWTQLLHRNDGRWYVYAVGAPPPTSPAEIPTPVKVSTSVINTLGVGL